MEVRLALPGDLPAMRRMALTFHSASCYAGVIPPDLDDFEDTIVRLIKRRAGSVLVADHDGRVCGMAAFVVSPHWFNRRHIVGNELFWWVEPEARASGVGVTLLDEMEQLAAAHGCHTFHMANTANLRPKALARLYRMRGYVPQDIYFAKALKPWQDH